MQNNFNWLKYLIYILFLNLFILLFIYILDILTSQLQNECNEILQFIEEFRCKISLGKNIIKNDHLHMKYKLKLPFTFNENITNNTLNLNIPNN